MWLEEISGIVVGGGGSEEKTSAALTAWAKDVPPDGMQDAIYQTAAIAYMAGQLFVRTIEAPGIVEDGERKLVDTSTGGDQFIGLPFEDAIRMFMERRIVSPQDFYAALGTMRQRAFTASLLARGQVTEAAMRSLLEILRNGGGVEDFAAAVRAEEISLGIAPSAHGYLRTVLDTNVTTAYGAGRMKQLTHPSVVKALPWRMYVAVRDRRTRPEHIELHGKTWRSDDVTWHRFMPPNGFNCRCTLIAVAPGDSMISEGQIARSVTHPDSSFDGPPGLAIET